MSVRAWDCRLDDSAAFVVHGQRPKVVVAPRTAEEAAEVLKQAQSEGLSVECAGAGTRLDSGNFVRVPDVVMTSVRMNAIAEYEPADLVIAVGAGASLRTLREAAAPYNQFCALDPAVSDDSTLGSVVATASAGPLRMAHGTPRDQVLGLQVVTGDGRILNFGGRVVKNVAGYDVVRLLTGSRGTLGFITRVNVRLKPLPEVDRTMLMSAASFEAVANYADAIVGARLEPVALEILSPVLARSVVGTDAWALLARLHGNSGGVDDAAARMQRIGNAEAADAAAWNTLRAAEHGANVRLRLANLPGRVRETMSLAQRTAESAGLSEAGFAVHCGDGIVRIVANGAGSSARAAILHARTEIEDSGGTLIVERMPGSVDVEAFGQPDGLQLMALIKKSFDPAGVLGAGRFVV